MNDRWIKQVNNLEISSFRPECSKGTPWEEKSFKFDLKITTWYKDLSISLRYSRDDDHSIDVILQTIINQYFNCVCISIQLGHSTVTPFYLNPA